MADLDQISDFNPLKNRKNKLFVSPLNLSLDQSQQNGTCRFQKELNFMLKLTILDPGFTRWGP